VGFTGRKRAKVEEWSGPEGWGATVGRIVAAGRAGMSAGSPRRRGDRPRRGQHDRPRPRPL